MKTEEAPQQTKEAPQQTKEALQQILEPPYENLEPLKLFNNGTQEFFHRYSENSLMALRNFSNVTKIFF